MVAISASTLGAWSAGLAAGQPVGQLRHRGGGFAQGLGEPGLLGGVQAHRMGEDDPASLAQHHRGGLERGQVLLGVGGHEVAVRGGAGEQAGMVTGWDRPDEVQAQRGQPGEVGLGVLPGVEGQRGRARAAQRRGVAPGQLLDHRTELGDVDLVARVGPRQQRDAPLAGRDQPETTRRRS